MVSVVRMIARGGNSDRTGAGWDRNWLHAAAAYNIAWGLFVVVWPNCLFDLCGMEHPNYPEIWQCVGMIVGVYGVGYEIAAADPHRHWPIVLVGLLGKIFGPVGFLMAVIQGRLPLNFGVTLLTNDVLWWIPFGMILWNTSRMSHCSSSLAFSPESRLN